MEERRQIRGRGMVAHGEGGRGHYREKEKQIRGDSGMEGDTLRERHGMMGLWSQMARPVCSIWHDLTVFVLEASPWLFPGQASPS